MANDTKVFYKPLHQAPLQNTSQKNWDCLSPNELTGMHVISMVPTEPAKLSKTPRLKVFQNQVKLHFNQYV